MNAGMRVRFLSWRLLLLGLWFLSVASAVLCVAVRPEYNLDGVFYSALMSERGVSIKDAHARVYAELQEELPPSAVALLVDSSP
jgi:hypothetical protein